MAEDATAVVLPARGYIYTAPVDTPAPTYASLLAPTSPWEALGHTSREELPEFGFDGGESEVKGTWQNASLRNVETEVPADYVEFQAHQFDVDVLSFYYGGTGGATAEQWQYDSTAATAQERAILIVVVDGGNHVGFHAHKVSLKRADSVEMDVEEFAAFPIRATFLKSGSNPTFSWIHDSFNAVP